MLLYRRQNWKGSALYNCLVQRPGLWIGDHGIKGKRKGKEGMASGPTQPEQFHCYLLYILGSCKRIHLEKSANCLKKKRKEEKRTTKKIEEKKHMTSGLSNLEIWIINSPLPQIRNALSAGCFTVIACNKCNIKYI